MRAFLGLLAFIPSFVVLIAGEQASAQTPQDDAFVRGIVRAVREAAISTDINRQITSLPLKEGTSFQTGDILAQFDCGELEADRDAAAARLSAEVLKYDNDKRLAKLNAVGEFDLKLQGVKVEQAKAEHRGLTERTSRCVIRAPYDGRIAELFANEFEFPSQGKPLMHIIGRSALEIELILPATWLRWLEIGTRFNLKIDEIDQDFPARIKSIAPVVDAVSQTVEVVAEFVGDASTILPGMSGPANFTAPND